MARDKSKPGKEPDKTAAEYYELKSDAVNELINANVTNTPEISKKELNRYRRKSIANIPEGLKYFLIKWWFAGVVCWFFMIGMGPYINTLDIIVIMGVVTGLLWDLPVNIFIRMKADRKDYSRYMMFPKTGVPAGILNVIYGIVLIILTAMTYTALNALLQSGGEAGTLGVGPVIFGIFTTGWDWLLLQCKKMGGAMLADAKKSASAQAAKVAGKNDT